MGGLGLFPHSPSPPFITSPIPSEEGPRLTRSQDTRDCLPRPCPAVSTWLQKNPSHRLLLKEPLLLCSSTADGAKHETHRWRPGDHPARQKWLRSLLRPTKCHARSNRAHGTLGKGLHRAGLVAHRQLAPPVLPAPMWTSTQAASGATCHQRGKAVHLGSSAPTQRTGTGTPDSGATVPWRSWVARKNRQHCSAISLEPEAHSPKGREIPGQPSSSPGSTPRARTALGGAARSRGLTPCWHLLPRLPPSGFMCLDAAY